jgi:hypothetical protein
MKWFSDEDKLLITPKDGEIQQVPSELPKDLSHANDILTKEPILLQA